MPQFLALVKRDYAQFKEADFTPLLEEEAERARAMYAAGTVRAMWGRADGNPGAVVVLEAATLEEAQAHMATLPLAAKGMLVMEFIALTPYRGFGPRG